jgi:hypothetical protein
MDLAANIIDGDMGMIPSGTPSNRTFIFISGLK